MLSLERSLYHIKFIACSIKNDKYQLKSKRNSISKHSMAFFLEIDFVVSLQRGAWARLSLMPINGNTIRKWLENEEDTKIKSKYQNIVQRVMTWSVRPSIRKFQKPVNLCLPKTKFIEYSLLFSNRRRNSTHKTYFRHFCDKLSNAFRFGSSKKKKPSNAAQLNVLRFKWIHSLLFFPLNWWAKILNYGNK